MTSPTSDRRQGLVGNTPIKAPVTVVATTPITLSGEQTIDTIAVKEVNAAGVPDRVLATAQADATKNGIWDVSTAAWTRSKDADGNYDIVAGTQVVVTRGTNAFKAFIQTVLGNITIGTTALAWSVNASASFLATLAASGGSSLVGFIQSGAGAVARFLQDKLRDEVSVMDFGGVGTGLVNDSAAFAAAFVSLGALGGTVTYPRGKKFLISTDLYIPANCTLKGPMSKVGSPQNNSSAPYAGVGALILASANRIIPQGGAGIDGALIYRSGMTFPAADSSAFAGTAVDVGGDDAFVTNSMILGFSTAIHSDGFQRPRLTDVNFDCLNGIAILNCADVCYVRGCHGWPFATIAAGGAAASLQRSGTAFKFSTLCDWGKVSDCFSYAYFRGFYAASVNSMTFMNCSADSTGGFAGQIGFVNDGTSLDTRFIGCQAAAQDTGFHFGQTAGNHAWMNSSDSWGCTGRGVYVALGDLTVNGGVFRTMPTGIDVQNGTSTVVIDSARFSALTIAPINVTVNNTTVFIGNNNDYGDWTIGTSVTNNTNRLQRSVASATNMALPNTGDYFQVTGTTAIVTINAGWAGRRVTLKFTGNVTITNGASILLAGAANMAATANDVLMLVHDGGAWYEVARSVN